MMRMNDRRAGRAPVEGAALMSGAMLTTMLVLFAISIPVALAIGIATIVGIAGFTSFPMIVARSSRSSRSTSFAGGDPVLHPGRQSDGGRRHPRRLVEFARSIVWWRRHLRRRPVVTCMIFAAISGSSVATTFAIGTIMIPALVRAGYLVPLSRRCRQRRRNLCHHPAHPDDPVRRDHPDLDPRAYRRVRTRFLIGGALIATVLVWCRIKGRARRTAWAGYPS